jgi:hypothetical protein
VRSIYPLGEDKNNKDHIAIATQQNLWGITENKTWLIIKTGRVIFGVNNFFLKQKI